MPTVNAAPRKIGVAFLVKIIHMGHGLKDIEFSTARGKVPLYPDARAIWDNVLWVRRQGTGAGYYILPRRPY